MLRYVLDSLSDLCLQQFRADVFKHLGQDSAIQDDQAIEATAEHLLLYYLILQKVLTDGKPWFVTSNKANIRDLKSLIDYLFD